MILPIFLCLYALFFVHRANGNIDRFMRSFKKEGEKNEMAD